LLFGPQVDDRSIQLFLLAGQLGDTGGREVTCFDLLLKLGCEFVDALTMRDFLNLESFDFSADSLLVSDQG
jgi:hypothetical protein